MSLNADNIYIGYHGTDYDNVESILKNRFRISDKADEWLGHGIYFFTEGISDPIENAKEWAINQAWDKVAKRYSYQKYAVLKAEVSGERVLDLTTTEGLRVYNEMRNLFIREWVEVSKRNLSQKHAVLEAEVSGKRVLGLTMKEGLLDYNEKRNLFIREYESLFDRGRDIRQDNCKMSNLIIKRRKLDILINHLYIKNKTQRILNLVSNAPNTTVMLVTKPQSIKSIKIISSGEII
jgi:hypothetical protein